MHQPPGARLRDPLADQGLRETVRLNAVREGALTLLLNY